MAFHGAKDGVGSYLAATYLPGSGAMQLVAGAGDRFGDPPFWVTLLPPGRVDQAGRVLDASVMLVYECTARAGDRLVVAPVAADGAFVAGSAAMMYLMAGHIAELQAAASSFVHTQSTPAASWPVVHNLGRRPQVMIADSAGTVIEGDITHIDDYRLRLDFSSVFSGKAFLR